MASRSLFMALFCCVRRDFGREPAYRVQDIDSRISCRAPASREDDMPVQNRANRVGNRLVEVVSFHQTVKEAGDRSLAKLARALRNTRGSRFNYRRRYPF
jgi:hypothetical protein